jgi:hypothetical protein
MFYKFYINLFINSPYTAAALNIPSTSTMDDDDAEFYYSQLFTFQQYQRHLREYNNTPNKSLIKLK